MTENKNELVKKKKIRKPVTDNNEIGFKNSDINDILDSIDISQTLEDVLQGQDITAEDKSKIKSMMKKVMPDLVGTIGEVMNDLTDESPEKMKSSIAKMAQKMSPVINDLVQQVLKETAPEENDEK